MIKRIKDDEITAYAAQITYYLILSIFPFMIFFITILGRTNLIVAGIEGLTNMMSFVPQEISDLLDQVLTEITGKQSDTFVSLSIIITIYSASRGVRAIMRGMNKAYKARETRGVIQKFFISFIYTIGLALVIVAALALVVFGSILGKMLFDWLGIGELYGQIWDLLRIGIPVLLIMVILLFIYRATPNVKLTFKQVIPGAIFSTLGSFIASGIFSFYVNHFADYSVVYGSIGSIIILLLWIYIISIVLILGGELNASLKIYQEKIKTD